MRTSSADPIGGEQDGLFEQIAEAIHERGYVILDQGPPEPLLLALLLQIQSTDASRFSRAGIGRDQDHTLDGSIRKDELCWITGSSDAGRCWLDWAADLQGYLNRRLMLGLFSFESHFAHYPPGGFYKIHSDAFKGETNRVLSLVLYLNPDWVEGDGGELVLYPTDAAPIKVAPRLGTLVAFLSEEFPHEVLVANRDRYSIAGWFRVNSSTSLRVDPPT